MNEKLIRDRYRIIKPIGNGTFGTAYLAENTEKENRLEVIKKIHIESFDKFNIKKVLREAFVLALLDHENILKYYGDFIDKEGNFFFLSTEFCEGGSLFERIMDYENKGIVLEENAVLNWFQELISGLSFLFERNILHRDINSSNIFIKNEQLKFGDFGLAKLENDFRTSKALSVVGTTLYKSPEMILDNISSRKSDIWALGVVLYEICTFRRPFTNTREILSNETPDLPERYSKNLNSLFKKMLDKTPETRILINEVIDYLHVKYNISINTILNKKNFQTPNSNGQNKNIEYDLFISYKSNEFNNDVYEFYDKLNNTNEYKIWLDKNDMVVGDIDKSMNDGLWNSKVVLCCLSKDYIKTNSNTMKEHQLAVAIQKPIIYVFFESVENLKYIEILTKYKEIAINLAQQKYFKSKNFCDIKKAIDFLLKDRNTGVDFQLMDDMDDIQNVKNDYVEDISAFQNYIEAKVLTNCLVITGSGDKTIKIWNIETGQCIKKLNGHTKYVLCLLLLKSGLLVSGSWDKTIKIWNIETEECTKTLRGHTNSVRSLLSNDVNLISGSEDNSIKIWNIETGECLKTMYIHNDSIWCCMLLDNNVLVSCSDDNFIKFTNIETDENLKLFGEEETSYLCLLMLNDRELVTGDTNKNLKVWNIETGSCLKTFTGHNESVWCLLALKSGIVVSGSWDKTIKVWNIDIENGNCLRTLKGHSAAVRCITSLNNDLIISGSEDNSIKIWNIENGKCLKTITAHIKFVLCLIKTTKTESLEDNLYI